MKGIFYILFIFTISVNGQSKIDSLLLNKINQYRISKNLDSLNWSDKIYISSQHNSNYMKENRNVSHFNSEYRDSLTGGLSKGECVAYISRINTYADKRDSLNINNVCNTIVNGWINSPKGHNKILLKDNVKYGSASISIDTVDYFDKKDKYMGQYFHIYSTFNCY
jgi:uncharacterized protein YkwD